MTGEELKYQRKALLEYELAIKIEQALKFCLPNFLEVNKFNPDTYDKITTESLTQTVDNTFINDDIYYLASGEDDEHYYLDCSTGLIYAAKDNGFRVAMNGCVSSEYDVFDAAYLRRYFVDPAIRHSLLAMPGGFTEITTLSYLGLKIEDIFSVPILEYTATSMSELKDIINEFEGVLSQSKFFRKLWFRGQRSQYTVNRSENTLSRIGFPKPYSEVPSLIPSLGRNISKDTFGEKCKSNMHWLMAFRIWTITHNPEFSPFLSMDSEWHKQLIKSLDPEDMTQIKMNSKWYEILDLDEHLMYRDDLDDVPGILAIQQYGGPTSGLDITDDLDVALFFTQSFLNTNTKCFELCDPQPGNVIYLFAQCRNTCTVNLSTDMFKMARYEWDVPVSSRISQQKCGLLRGANIFARNTYAHRIIAKIYLQGSDMLTTKTVNDMFPSMDEDTLYRNFSYAVPTLNGLYG